MSAVSRPFVGRMTPASTMVAVFAESMTAYPVTFSPGSTPRMRNGSTGEVLSAEIMRVGRPAKGRASAPRYDSTSDGANAVPENFPEASRHAARPRRLRPRPLRVLPTLSRLETRRPKAPWSCPDGSPSPIRTSSIHHEHMTVTVERFYGQSVDVEVQESRREGNAYSRKILLRLSQTGEVVQMGIVRIDLGLCSPEVAARIVEGKTPLGRILIEHDVLRRIEHAGFFEVDPSDDLGWNDAGKTYGRLGVIFCDYKPAIEVLEILAPITSQS